MQDTFSPKESLLLIQSMIEKTKSNLSDNRYYFLLWGWLAFTALIAQFILKRVLQFPYHYMVWLVTIVGVFATIYHVKKHAAATKARTYVGDSMQSLWMGMGISFFVLIVLFSKIGWQYCYPFFILMYGLGTFVSGKIIRFKPFVIGGIINWVLACIAVFVAYDFQMLLAAAAIACSYLVPAYLIKKTK